MLFFFQKLYYSPLKAYLAAMQKSSLFSRKSALARLAVEEKRIEYAISLTEFESRIFVDPLEVKNNHYKAKIIATGLTFDEMENYQIDSFTKGKYCL